MNVQLNTTPAINNLRMNALRHNHGTNQGSEELAPADSVTAACLIGSSS